MDIEQKLNELTMKYNIDKHMPKFRMYLKALGLAEQEYARLLQTYDEVVLVGGDEVDLEWFQRVIGKKRSSELLIDTNEESNVYEIETNTVFFVISFYGKDEILVKLLESNLNVVSLYDVFELNGVYFDNNFYDLYAQEYHAYRTKEKTKDIRDFNITRIFFYHRRNYELGQSNDIKKLYLEQLIFDCVYAKDFVLLKKYIDIYVLNYSSDEMECEYYLFYQEVSRLLEEIKLALKKRNKKDCIMVWIDALEFGEDSDMQFLKGIESEALCFQRIYTVTPYTGPTYLTLFAKSRRIEEESYKIEKLGSENSSFIRELKKRNYQFKSYDTHRFAASEHEAPYFHYNNIPVCQIYWDALRDLLMEDENISCFLVLFSNCTHAPYISLGITGGEYSYTQAWPGKQNKNDQEVRKKQGVESRQWLDKQLSFWADLLPKHMYKIYMSDHGHTFLGKYHPIMKIQQEEIKPRYCNQVISYYNFDQLIMQILDNNQIEDGILGNGEAIIQDVDYYHKDLILEVIKRQDFSDEAFIGYQGIVTEKDLFILYHNGAELYQKHQNDECMVSDERLRYLRSRLSEKRIDIEKEEKFKYSRLIWSAIKKCEYRTRETRAKKVQVLQKLFLNIPEGAAFAIRAGGIETLRLLMLLDEKCRQKVRYIIDKNVECYSGKMGIKVITPDDIENVKIEYILVASYKYGADWKNELKEITDAQIIDLYEVLQTEGIQCSKEFYRNEYQKEDFEGLIDSRSEE